MLIVISGRVTRDVGLESRSLSKEFQTEIAEMTDAADLMSPLTGVVLFPTILHPDLGPMEDDVTNRKDGDVYVALNIEHARWMNSTTLEKLICLLKTFQYRLRK